MEKERDGNENTAKEEQEGGNFCSLVSNFGTTNFLRGGPLREVFWTTSGCCVHGRSYKKESGR